MTILGSLEELILLCFMHADGEYHAATINEILTEAGRPQATGALYATVNRLEQKGLLSSRMETSDGTKRGRPRRYYRLTDVAKEALAQAEKARTVARLSRLWIDDAQPSSLNKVL